MTTCTDPRCLDPDHEHARPLSPLQAFVAAADPLDLARWHALMATKALRVGDGRTAIQAVETAITVLSLSGGDRDLGTRLCEAGAALVRGNDKRALTVLARMVLERQDALVEFDVRLAAADRATEEAA